MTVAKIETAEPAKICTPKMVENQVGSSDIAQSKEANVQREREEGWWRRARNRCACRVSAGSLLSSCRVESPKKRMPRKIHTSR